VKKTRNRDPTSRGRKDGWDGKKTTTGKKKMDEGRKNEGERDQLVLEKGAGGKGKSAVGNRI